MMLKRFILLKSVCLIIFVSLMTSGCAVNFYKQSPRAKKQIKELKGKISDLEAERRRERKQFEEVRRMLESKLKGQIADDQVSFRLGEGGLVVILSDEILFASGKAELKSEAYPVLDKLAKVIKREVPDKDIGVSGHTDNVPIQHSSWPSNWELSTRRATNVLHYLEDKGISPRRLSATGYGEHRPLASNNSSDGRAKNRRVEIVILPEFSAEKISDSATGNNFK